MAHRVNPGVDPARDSIVAAIACALVAVFAIVLAGSAQAEIGPCKPDKEMLLCSSGKGAARVIPDTTSPDKKFALAWHDPNSEPDDVEDFGNEFLLIRLADGAVLAKADTDYFRNPRMHANRVWENATWSPDSRMVVRQYNTRWSTDALTLYRIGADGALAGQTDLLAIVEPVVRARLKKIGRDPESYVFSAGNEGSARLGNDGLFSFEAIMFVIKKEPEVDYKIAVKATPGKDGARIVSIRRTVVK